jgi:carbamoyl-phosphate synthase large subunit
VNVLVTGAGALLGQGIIKALRSSARVSRIIAVDSSPRAVGLYVADSAHVVPKCRDASYLPTLIELCKREKVAVIFCGTDLEVPILAEHRAEIERATRARMIVSSPESVAIADDKWLTVEFLRTNGLDAPRSALADGARELVREIGFPVVVKPRIGAGSVGLSVARNERDLEKALEVDGMIVQEYLLPDDEEFTVGTLVFDRKCHSVVALQRTLRYGNTHTATSGDFPDVAAHAALVAERLPGAYGPVNVQLRRTPRGPVVFEINARFSGTTPLRAELGFNEVDVLLRHLVDGEPIPPVKLRRAIILRWTSEVVVPLDDLETMTNRGILPHPRGEMMGADVTRR